MKILVICNNYGQQYDGIGSYAKVIYGNLGENINAEICSNNCRGTSMFKRVLGMGMTCAFLTAVKKVVAERYDRVIIEYPFIEWNPLFLVSAVLLKMACTLRGIEFISSIHEYERANVLRKLVVLTLCLMSSKLLVTEKNNYKFLKKINSNIFKIEIPSNILVDFDSNKKNSRAFVYFGTVNKSKAFKEMLDGWDEFNKDLNYELSVVTSSDLIGLEKHKNVNYIHNATDIEVSEVMIRSAFSILPIKPSVDEKNGTFKTSCLAGCVCIGQFCEEYNNLEFTVNMEDYTPENFKVAFNSVSRICEEKLDAYYKMSASFGERFSADKARQKLSSVLMENN